MRIFIYSLIVATAVFCVYFWHNTPEWSNVANAEMKRSEAIDHCKNLKEPGHWEHTDWRLPTSSELAAKELDNNKYWASDSANLDTEAKMSVICVRNMPEKAEEEIVAKDENTVSPEETGQTPPSRGKKEDSTTSDKPKPEQTAKSGRYKKCKRTFTIEGDPNLIWCYLATTKRSKEEAKQYCEAIQHEGKTGWRLPTSNELDNLKPDYEKYFPDSDYPPQLFCISRGKGLYWDRFAAEQPNQNDKVKEAHCICVHKN